MSFPLRSACGRAGRAVAALNEADQLEARPPFSHLDTPRNRLEAERLRAQAGELLKPVGTVVAGAGEVVMWTHTEGHPWDHATSVADSLRDTLEYPNTIGIQASTQRLEAALDLGILEASVDAADTIQAANAIEKMLAHQLAAAHHTAMKLLHRSGADGLQPADVVRFTNAAARMIEMYQAGCLAMLKLKAGGTQRIIVQQQQVNVAPGGQALVAGRVARDSRAERTRKNGG